MTPVAVPGDVEHSQVLREIGPELFKERFPFGGRSHEQAHQPAGRVGRNDRDSPHPLGELLGIAARVLEQRSPGEGRGESRDAGETERSDSSPVSREETLKKDHCQQQGDAEHHVIGLHPQADGQSREDGLARAPTVLASEEEKQSQGSKERGEDHRHSEPAEVHVPPTRREQAGCGDPGSWPEEMPGQTPDRRDRQQAGQGRDGSYGQNVLADHLKGDRVDIEEQSRHLG